MFKYNIRIVLFIAACSCATLVAAQEEKDDEGKKLDRQMLLEREYDPSVQDANKVNMLPAVKEPQPRKIPINYATLSVPYDPEKQIVFLPSGDAMTEVLHNKRRGYLNVSGGSGLNFSGDVGYHILSTEKDQLNFWFSHRSNFGKVKYVQIDEKFEKKLNDNLVNLDFKHAFNKSDFSLGLKYAYNAYNHYGIYPLQAQQSVFNYDADRDAMQNNQYIDAHLGLQSKEDSKVGYLIDLNYVNFFRRYGLSKKEKGIKEHNFEGNFGLSSDFNGNQTIGLGLDVAYLGYGIDNTQSAIGFQNRFFGTLNPYYNIAGDNWNIRLGAKVMFYTGKEGGDKSHFFASPNVNINVAVADKTELYLSADGRTNRNSAYGLSKENLYINPTLVALPSRVPVDAKIGIKSGVAPGFWFDIFGGFRMTDNDCFFIPRDMAVAGELSAMSNNIGLDSKLLYVGASLKYAFREVVEFRLKGVYNNWKVKQGDYALEGIAEDKEFKAFYRPEFEFDAGVDIRPIKRLKITADYHLKANRYAYLQTIEHKLDNINDLSASCSYLFSDAFTLYARVNNLLFQKYDIWYGMPNLRFNVQVGVNLNF